MKEIKTKKGIDSVVRIPGSKSLTHRALIASGLARGESLLKDILLSEDTLYTADALKALGVGISIEGENTIVTGTGGNFLPASVKKEIYLGNSGTSYRLLLSIVALARGEFILTGSRRMYERPIGNLVKALNKLGVVVSFLDRNGFPPVSIMAKGIQGGKVKISGEISSQFISSLLLSAPYADSDIEIEVIGEMVSAPYVELTLEVMKRFGVSYTRDGYGYFKVPAGQGYEPCHFPVEGDFSSASYFWAAAAITGERITTENLRPLTTKQGDLGLLKILEKMGCQISREHDRVVVKGGALSGIDVDMSNLPDMVPTVAAIALFARGRTTIRNVPHLRHKESDRLHAVALEWKRLGDMWKSWMTD
jgi:3-phosphoshikimate 1-carboxyvinyltransferase